MSSVPQEHWKLLAGNTHDDLFAETGLRNHRHPWPLSRRFFGGHHPRLSADKFLPTARNHTAAQDWLSLEGYRNFELQTLHRETKILSVASMLNIIRAIRSQVKLFLQLIRIITSIANNSPRNLVKADTMSFFSKKRRNELQQ